LNCLSTKHKDDITPEQGGFKEVILGEYQELVLQETNPDPSRAVHADVNKINEDFLGAGLIYLSLS